MAGFSQDRPHNAYNPVMQLGEEIKETLKILEEHKTKNLSCMSEHISKANTLYSISHTHIHYGMRILAENVK